MSTPRRRPLAIGAAALALLAGACSDGDDDTSSTTTGADRSTTTVEAEVDEATSTTGEPACPQDPQPIDSEPISGDVDGDGQADELRSVQTPDQMTISVELAAGGGAQLGLPTFGIQGTGLVGPADMDGDGGDELWVRTGSGASAAILGLVVFADCTLVQVTYSTGDPVELPVGGSVGTSAGLTCDTSVDPEADLTSYLAGNIDEATYEVTATEYALEGTTLDQLGTTTSTVRTDDPAFGQYVTFACEGLAL